MPWKKEPVKKARFEPLELTNEVTLAKASTRDSKSSPEHSKIVQDAAFQGKLNQQRNTFTHRNNVWLIGQNSQIRAQSLNNNKAKELATRVCANNALWDVAKFLIKTVDRQR